MASLAPDHAEIPIEKGEIKETCKVKKAPIPPGFRTVTHTLRSTVRPLRLTGTRKHSAQKSLRDKPSRRQTHARPHQNRRLDSNAIRHLPRRHTIPRCSRQQPGHTPHLHQQRGQAMAASRRRRSEGDYAIGQPVLGRTIRPTNRPYGHHWSVSS